MAEISYVPTMLNSMAEICKKFKVNNKTVKKWVAYGAPIIIDGEGSKKRYSAELVDLYIWRKHQAGLR